MLYNAKYICEKCNVRLPKNRPKLVCSICQQVRHYRCQNLSKNDAQFIVDNSGYQWSCRECISDILPINACSIGKRRKPDLSSNLNKFKVKCASCDGHSYTPKNVKICHWCEQQDHAKCCNNNLGCNTCCENMIPGFHAYSHELHGTTGLTNDSTFNPYDRTHATNLIGDMIANEEEHNSVWSEISDFLIKCEYKQLNRTVQSKNNELKVMSLNIRSLCKNIQTLRDDTEQYHKFDVLCFNETNCVAEKLPNGLSDLLIEGFHEPILQAPIRNSGRGGGLAIYINKKVCESEDIEKFDPNPDPSNPSGEFQFVKINQCKGSKNTVILGNIYRSPSRNPDNFNTLL